jgi:3-hydroxybutyryl-CoA dehydrogenase
METERIGIVGSGTMGSGIALAALYAGFGVILQDPFPEALAKAREYLVSFLARKGLSERISMVSFSESLDGLASAQIVIEAAIESLELKKQIFSRLDEICPPGTILATNTSTLPVTEIAASTRHRARVAGMHFFNPAAVLKLVEVVQGMDTSQATIEKLVRLAEKLGKTPVVTRDTPGFIVNRVARPFYGEALRLFGEQAAGHDEIDRVLEQGAGFRMGPFRLMDLIGIDVNATAMRSMYEQTFGEPRYRPHWIQMQMMRSGRLGRKTGRGFYDYENPAENESEAVSDVKTMSGAVLLSAGSFAGGLAEKLTAAGLSVVDQPGGRSPVMGFVAAGRAEGFLDHVRQIESKLPPDAPLLVQCADITLSSVAPQVQNPERLMGFDGLFLEQADLVTLIPSAKLTEAAREKAAALFAALGCQVVWISDSPGLILPRVVCMLVNEAAFAVLEGVAEAETIDLAMQLGVNYPHGPLSWGQLIGFERVLAVLDHLRSEYGEERYRACHLLRRWAREFAPNSSDAG